jgi:hypothetical protein
VVALADEGGRAVVDAYGRDVEHEVEVEPVEVLGGGGQDGGGAGQPVGGRGVAQPDVVMGDVVATVAVVRVVVIADTGRAGGGRCLRGHTRSGEQQRGGGQCHEEPSHVELPSVGTDRVAPNLSKFVEMSCPAAGPGQP